MADERYIAAHVTAYPADKGNVLISNRSTGRSGLLSEQLFGVLRQADRFDTLAGHARRLLAAGWEDDAIYLAITVCAMFNFYNRWIDASGVHALSEEAHRQGGKRTALHGYARD